MAVNETIPAENIIPAMMSSQIDIQRFSVLVYGFYNAFLLNEEHGGNDLSNRQ